MLQGLVRIYPKLRVVGAGHSFNALAKTSDVLVCLDQLKGMCDYDREKCRSTFWAGTRLYDVGEKLATIIRHWQTRGILTGKVWQVPLLQVRMELEWNYLVFLLWFLNLNC
jgi:hypothetical protein